MTRRTMPEHDAFRLFRVAFDLGGLIAARGADALPSMADDILARHHAAHLRPVVNDWLADWRAWDRDNAAEAAIATALRQGLPVFEPGGLLALAEADIAIRAAKGGEA